MTIFGLFSVLCCKILSGGCVHVGSVHLPT
jgi:hypothetical protein